MFISERHQLVPEAKIFVKNIPTHISLQQLHDKFREVSANVFVHINTDEKGKRLDFGFVHYKAKEDAELALKAFKDLELGGQELQLSRWVGKETRQVSQYESRKNLYLRNLPPMKKKIIEKSLTILLLPFGEIESMLVKKAPSFNVNYALVSFKTAESAQRALKEISDRPTYLEGAKEPLSISWYQRRTERANIKDHEMNAIFVENLKMTSKAGKVREALMRYGRILTVNLCSGEAVEGKGMTRCGHVVFEYASSAEAAFNECKLSPEFQSLFIGEAELSLTHYTVLHKNPKESMRKQDRDLPSRRKSSFNSNHQQELAPPQESPIKNMPPMPQMTPCYPNMYYPYYSMGYYYPMATPYGYPPMYDPNMYNMMMDQNNQNMMMSNNENTEADEKKRGSYKKGVNSNKKSGPSSVGSLSTLDDCHVEDSETPDLSVTENNSTTSDSLEIDPRDWKDDKKCTPFVKGKSGRATGMWKAKRKYGTKKPKVVELVENAE